MQALAMDDDRTQKMSANEERAYIIQVALNLGISPFIVAAWTWQSRGVSLDERIKLHEELDIYLQANQEKYPWRLE